MHSLCMMSKSLLYKELPGNGNNEQCLFPKQIEVFIGNQQMLNTPNRPFVNACFEFVWPPSLASFIVKDQLGYAKLKRAVLD